MMRIWWDTTIWELRDAGIMPEWLCWECEEHGMDCAEYVLCEYDWEWDWDLGYGMSWEQLKVIEQVRQVIRDGIREAENDSEFQALLKQRQEEDEKRKEISKFCREKLKSFYKSESQRGPDSWVVSYILKNGDIPVFNILEIYLARPKSDTLSAMMDMAGVDSDPKSLEEIAVAYPEFNKAKIKRIAKKQWPIKQNIGELIMRLPEFLPNRPLAEIDQFWQDIISEQNLTHTPIQLMRIVALVSPDYKIEGDLLVRV